MPRSRPVRLLSLLLVLVCAAALLQPAGHASAGTAGHAGNAGSPGTGDSRTSAGSRTTTLPHRPKKKAKTPDRTSRTEAHRVDRVRTPKLRWYRCDYGVQCATTRVPLDYDHPHGATVELALTRVKARDQRHRIGTLFVNPGGPGGSGTELAAEASEIFSDDLLDRFDVVGFDPRGTNSSTQLRCFSSARTQLPVVSVLQSAAFPLGTSQERTFARSAGKLGKACSTHGRPLSASMSTAEVARDMDVLRRAVGDRQLSYLGFSYGSYIGEVYANMFPDRVRAVALDGVIDPVAWRGSKSTSSVPQGIRIRSAQASWNALHELLVRCDRAGEAYCAYAAGNPVQNLATMMARLKKHPISYIDPFSGESVKVSYTDAVSMIASTLYSDQAPDDVTFQLAMLHDLVYPPSASARRAGHSTAKAARYLATVSRRLRELGSAGQTEHVAGRSFPYDNDLEAYTAVACTDGLHPKSASSFAAAGARADRTAPYFGRLWAWTTAGCGTQDWKATDEDAYHGSFSHRSSSRVLVVGNRWDPATNYVNAQRTAGVLTNSMLVTSDNWGHTAYGTSECLTEAMDRYLLTVRIPAAGLSCHTGYRPFSVPLAGDGGSERVRPRTTPATVLRDQLLRADASMLLSGTLR